jgi:hypothetical protein
MCIVCRVTGDKVAVGSVVKIVRRCKGRFDNDKGAHLARDHRLVVVARVGERSGFYRHLIHPKY